VPNPQAPGSRQPADAVRAARARFGGYLAPTPVVRSTGLCDDADRPAWLKLENLQPTGSFKVRGALNKLRTLGRTELDRGIITASTGNHGAAVAWAAAIVGAEVRVVVPAGANPAKLAAIERLGARIETIGSDSVEAEHGARRLAVERGATFVSPYNDLDVIAGQGTLAAELHEQVGKLEAVYVAVGGGGLAAGVAGYLADVAPGTRIVGCSPAASAVMYHSLQAGRVLELPSEPTLSDGTAGGVERDAITFGILDRLLDDFVLVDEVAIRTALIELIDVEHLLVEGSAAMAYAAAREHARAGGGAIAVIMCGGNVGSERLRAILA
jgi:threonine dehydratase